MPTYVKDEIRCITEGMRQRILPAQLERRVYEQLRDEILSGTLTTGAQLVEARIATDLGVSKTPVREALIRLQRDGLVEIEPYRGARVIEPAEADIREILELRILLECHIARDLARRRPPEVLDSLERTIEECRQALQTGDDTKVLSALTEFSDVMADAGGNRRLEKALDELRSVLLMIANTSLRRPGREERSLAEHERILAAIRAGDADEAATATEAHIRSIEEDSIGSDGALATEAGSAQPA
jgi:GntR family transcriptional regulator, rspAB operon transcriptional repressor